LTAAYCSDAAAARALNPACGMSATTAAKLAAACGGDGGGGGGGEGAAPGCSGSIRTGFC